MALLSVCATASRMLGSTMWMVLNGRSVLNKAYCPPLAKGSRWVVAVQWRRRAGKGAAQRSHLHRAPARQGLPPRVELNGSFADSLSLISPLLSRIGRRAGLVTSRQTFVRRRHLHDDHKPALDQA